MAKVFVSHANRDRELVEKVIVVPLKEAGYETWYSTENSGLTHREFLELMLHDGKRKGVRYEWHGRKRFILAVV